MHNQTISLPLSLASNDKIRKLIADRLLSQIVTSFLKEYIGESDKSILTEEIEIDNELITVNAKKVLLERTKKDLIRKKELKKKAEGYSLEEWEKRMGC